MDIKLLLEKGVMTMGGIQMEYKVNFLWDEEASVWVATSEDVPGLILESGSFDALKERVKIAIPELLSLNNLPPMKFLVMHSECRQQVYC